MNKLTCSRMADFYWRIVLSTPTTGDPDVLKLYTQPSASPTSTRHSRACFEQTFQDGQRFSTPVCVPVFASCVVVVAPLQPQIRRELLLIFVFIYCENSTGFAVFNITVRFVLSLLCCCRVSLQPQCSSSSVIVRFVLCVSCVVVEFHSSHSFTISPRIVVFIFSFCLLCCCRVSLQPQCCRFRRQVR